MNIQHKIEEIRQKPEYIRVRYFWVMMIISMFFILFLWIFSLKENLSSISIQNESTSKITEQIKEEFSGTQSLITDSFQKSSEILVEK
ncbi:MAG: hypothetical protein UR69_C0002G0071 [Candidatus Moranbacteria bacterium GW2011_GWE2_35_2-]|nr:MAG: hypothetical protein UR69_C0002G0071 [Candidatus Moranbacteria bacterium GW2011_GWE2_35_2-]KKQ05018.1 MAG: hypothetical protein US15_C0037G0015 [Candidatus Moranbacteria bacterium GW2011_GWF1_36_4]KKQ22580.1 MAG: hypothetical protein US37_C0002G0205 [Candidatus Moranbacteria bacterium GW2011_GWF2_37_11]KKQ28983.1 MAG: hypothetical protein US44_C0004G0027 [Candidatus Moranbacteria bacterium GW2011_GWD1_37_17]KKQ30481.1 MAG: hypothetical protein US47_C0002G0071 [Candidatus Moranbacteria b